jgi:hypothetical protein
MEKDLFLERVKSIIDYKTPEYGHLISEQAKQLKSFSLAQKGAADLASMFKMSIDDVRNAAKLATDTKAFNKAIAKDIAAGVQGTVGPAAKLLSKQKTIQELLKSGKLSDNAVIQIIERNKKESLSLVQRYKGSAGAKTTGAASAGSNSRAASNTTVSANKVVNVLGSSWKTMSKKKAIALLLTGGAGIAAIIYFLRNKSNPLPDCVINKLTDEQLKTLGDNVVFKTTGIKALDAYGGIVLKDDGTCMTGNGKYKGTYSCSGNDILIKIGNNTYTIPGGVSNTPTPTPPAKTEPSEKVKKIQQMLVRSGYYIGNTGSSKNGVDGYYGNRTDMAYKAWNGGESAEDFNNRVYKMGKTTQQGGTIQGGTIQGGTTQGGTQQGGTTQGGTQQGGTTQGGGDREINIVNPAEY